MSSGDPSLLRRLAISFGEGLAFSVAMKLTENVMRPRAAIAPRPQLRDKPRPAVSASTPAPAPTQAQIDQRVIQAIVSAVEKRLNEHAAQVEQRIEGLESSVSVKVQAAAARWIEQETSGLRSQVMTMQREFAHSVAGIVAENLAEQTKAMESKIQGRIEAAIGPLRQEIQELRQCVAESGKPVGELVSVISDAVDRAGKRLLPV